MTGGGGESGGWRGKGRLQVAGGRVKGEEEGTRALRDGHVGGK